MEKIAKVMVMVLVATMVVLELAVAKPKADQHNYDDMHPLHHRRNRREAKPFFAGQAEQNSAEYWLADAENRLNQKLNEKIITKPAKNVIMFLGDGMSITTLAAARIYKGQSENQPGEETYLSFEEFPHTALSKTYCVDSQVADSACSATAYLCGVKANEGTIGVTGAVPLGICEPSLDPKTHVDSIAAWSQKVGKRTGLVTTTRVTHASPTGVYGHTADRNWESDYDLFRLDVHGGCTDIAHQLIYDDTGKNLNVIMGGGRVKFLPNTVVDEEGQPGERLDGENLIEKWQELKSGEKSKYVWNRSQLLNVDTANTDYLLGLFESDHCKYNLDTTEEEPTLAEMTEAAIKVLNKGDKGYFLFVEGGRIDHGHHDTLAKKAVDETVQLSEAVRKAVEITSEEDTLIVITSDHAHSMTLNGYPDRGNPIFGFSSKGDDGLPIATLSYANGPGYKPEVNGKRHDLTYDNMHDNDYKFPAMAPLYSETHGGEDVGIFARGPYAHLYRGVLEQNVIPVIMKYASCVGDGKNACDNAV